VTPRHRLRGRRRFSAVRDTGYRASAGDVRVIAAPNHHTDARVGFALPGHRSAVTRNLLRRRLREAVRPLLAGLGGHDVVVTVPATATTVPYARLAADLATASARALRRSGGGQGPATAENGAVDRREPS